MTRIESEDVEWWTDVSMTVPLSEVMEDDEVEEVLLGENARARVFRPVRYREAIAQDKVTRVPHIVQKERTK